jgi:methionyl-tRNA synthetase
VDVPYFLSKYDPDPLRYYLTTTAPETRNTEARPEGVRRFLWEDFVERNHDELVATWGMQSVANRMLSFTTKRAAHSAVARLRRRYLDYDGQLFTTQWVVTYEEETRSHQALTYERRREIFGASGNDIFGV